LSLVSLIRTALSFEYHPSVIDSARESLEILAVDGILGLRSTPVDARPIAEVPEPSSFASTLAKMTSV